MPWNLLEQIEEQDHSIRHDAAECLRCAAMQMKKYYERKHTRKYFCVGDKVLLRLGRGYDIPVNQVLSRKLGRQYAGRSTVLERVGRLAYRLDLSKRVEACASSDQRATPRTRSSC